MPKEIRRISAVSVKNGQFSFFVVDVTVVILPRGPGKQKETIIMQSALAQMALHISGERGLLGKKKKKERRERKMKHSVWGFQGTFLAVPADIILRWMCSKPSRGGRH